jgi:hypothetical protein
MIVIFVGKTVSRRSHCRTSPRRIGTRRLFAVYILCKFLTIIDFSKLSAINFPLDDRFVIGLAKELSAKQQQQSTTVTTVDDGIWMEWLQHFRNRHGFDD